ncbi:protein FAM110B [Schistocerca americana]|uniref:protein FAM110B n=1 Tax=Schistocerca americana TaxID=7009 RepID=UPI001F502122|nr:protein FAM110B [Schistocerca americana]
MRALRPAMFFASSAKRKSAVELLQESKAFYVKSETVLDRQQQLKHSGHLQVTASPGVDPRLLRAPRYIHQHHHQHQQQQQQHHHHQQQQAATTQVLASPAQGPRPAPPPVPPRSPRAAAPAQRRSGPHATGGDQLQTKLRRLLNADSKENVFVPPSTSPPTAPTPPPPLSPPWDDSEVKTVAGDEHSLSCRTSGCSRHHKSLPDLHQAANTTGGTQHSQTPVHPQPHATSSGSSSRHSTRCCTRTQSMGSAMSTTSSGGRNQGQRNSSRHSSPSRNSIKKNNSYEEESADDDVRHPPTPNCKERVATRRPVEGPPSASSWSDSGPEEPLSPTSHHRFDDDDWRAERHHRPILRSKSDISHRYSRGPPPLVPRPEPKTIEQLEKFFEQLGLDTRDYRSMSTPMSGSSSPVYFESVSSVDSAVAWGPWGSGSTSGNTPRQAEQPSIVERNARIIKWLCNCRKAQLAVRTSS